MGIDLESAATGVKASILLQSFSKYFETLKMTKKSLEYNISLMQEKR